MEAFKLVKMTDYVLNIEKRTTHPYEAIQLAINYAKFLKTPLTLGMFVPCDEDGNILTNPFAMDYHAGTEKEIEQIKYNQAKERVLFKEFSDIYKSGDYIWITIENKFYGFYKSKTIEDLVNRKCNLTLTPKRS